MDSLSSNINTHKTHGNIEILEHSVQEIRTKTNKLKTLSAKENAVKEQPRNILIDSCDKKKQKQNKKIYMADLDFLVSLLSLRNMGGWMPVYSQPATLHVHGLRTATLSSHQIRNPFN